MGGEREKGGGGARKEGGGVEFNACENMKK